MPKLTPLQRKQFVAVSKLVENKSVKMKSKEKRAKDGITHRAVAPTNTAFNVTNFMPQYKSVKNGIRIRHTEYITDLTSSTIASAYNCEAFVINPANSLLFPWLSSQALAYASYIPNSITFSVESMVGTTTNGYVCLASTPDPSDAKPSSKSEMMQIENSTRANAWDRTKYTVPIEDLRRLPEFLTLSSNVDNSATHGVGNFYVASGGLLYASQSFGELYVTYDITLLHPQPTSGSSYFHNGYGVTPSSIFGLSNNVTASLGSGNIKVQDINQAGAVALNTLKVNRGGSFIFTFICSTPTAAGGGPVWAFEDIHHNSAGTSGYILTRYTGNQCMIIMRVNELPNPFWIISDTVTGANGTGSYLEIAEMHNANHHVESMPPLSLINLSELNQDKTEQKNEDQKDEYVLIKTKLTRSN